MPVWIMSKNCTRRDESKEIKKEYRESREQHEDGADSDGAANSDRDKDDVAEEQKRKAKKP